MTVPWKPDRVVFSPVPDHLRRIVPVLIVGEVFAVGGHENGGQIWTLSIVPGWFILGKLCWNQWLLMLLVLPSPLMTLMGF